MRGLRWLILGALCAAALPGPAEAAPPANDQFANATILVGESGSLVATTAEATAELGEPAHAGWPPERSVWFRLNVPETATYELGTCEMPGVETVVALYTGNSVSALTLVRDDDGGCDPGSFFSHELSPGTYHLAVDDLLAGGGGEFRLRWTRHRFFPRNTSPPTIAGDPVEGSTLTANPGTWTSDAGPLSYAYRWQRCSGSTCTTVGSDSATYGLGGPDVGYTYRVRVTATNRDGSESATSTVVGPVRVRSPINRDPPEIAGTPRVGQTLVLSSAGAWEASGIVFVYQWQRCTVGLVCANIAGAGDETYDLTAAERGFLIRVAVTATNAAGSATAFSASLGVVLAARVLPRACVVPRLRGKTLPAARKALLRAGCTVGKVVRAKSTMRKGRVVRQSAKPGRRLKPKARVGLVLSRGRNR